VSTTAYWLGRSQALVGRRDELARLEAATASPPSLAIVEGEAGIGKTRLVAELLAASDARRLVGHCEPLQDPLPLGPLLDALRRATGELDPIGNPVVGALAPLLPEIADRLPPPPPPLRDQRAERHRVFRAATALLDHLGPLILVLEDVHWADRGTLDFLAFLATHQPRDLALLLTVRSDAGRLPIREAFARAPAGPAISVTVPPLREPEVRELAEGILRVDLPLSFAASLYEKTSGIPFVVEEVLRTLLERMPASEIPGTPQALRDLAVPTALRDVVLQRLGSLDEDAREILGAAAVLGMVPDEEALAAIAGRGPAEIARALGSAQAAGLLRDSGFRHALAWQIVYEAVPAASRRWLHLEIARTLESRGDSPPVAQLAHHFRLAGRTADFVRSAEAAADLAISHGEDATAARFLMEAMEVADLPLEARVRLAVKLGRAAVDGLAQSEAMPILERLLAEEPLPAQARGELRFALGRLLRQQGEALAGYEQIERAVPDLEDRPALLGRALAILAAPETVVGRHVREHVARCEQAEAAARRSGASEVDLAVRIVKTSLLVELGDRRGWELIDALRRDDALLAAPREQARACLNWAQAALHVGHVRRAEALFAEGRRIVDQAEYLRLAGVVDLVGAAVDRAAGRWMSLEARARRLASEPTPFAAASLDARFLHAALLAAVGSADDARTALLAVIETAERVGAVWPLVPARATLSRLLLTVGDAPGAAEHARAGLACVRAKGNWVWGAETTLCLVEALDGASEARAVADELEAGLGDADAPLAQAALQVCRAVLDGDDALLEAARHDLEQAGLPYETAQVDERLGRLERALRAYGTLGATRDVARVCQTMRQRGIPIPYPWRGGRRAYGETLSPREREVAQLAAEGRTNEEIAAHLFLSRRTVESHVSSALKKLGCRSRKELRALLAAADAPG
jgi:DNA-binding CsgD family transcriptional regulator